MKIFNKIFGNANEKIIKEMQSIIDEINSLEPKFEKMSDKELREMTGEMKDRFARRIASLGGSLRSEETILNELLPEAFAVMREASKRVLSQRHYDVQLVGGIVLHRGQIAEMKTGEGKTLVATLSLYLNALNGKGVHLVTVNDYLSRVGAGWMAPVYYKLGLSTSVIIHDSALIYDPEYSDDSQFDERLKNFRKIERKEAYACDITYGTNNEFGFDYLRDNMAPSLDKMAQRPLNYAIVDEVDSILIDEARTPLIISAPAEESTDRYFKFAQLVTRLKENISSVSSDGEEEKSSEQGDYNVDEKMKAATLTEAGIAKMEKWLGVDNIYVSGGVREVHHIEQALKANVLFKRDKDYVVKEGEIIIVDEFTGRLMPGRRYSEGLHQAIEAKENVKVQRESQTLASITFQNYFRMYKKLSGMTGTAVTEAEEFSKIYNLETIIIPTNKPKIRKDDNDLIFRTELGKFKAVTRDVKELNKKGQPVLIGTISIEKNELLADLMEKEGLHPQVLNAKNHLKEAKFIAQAGKKGMITIATNMAGRGVDIILGGNPPEEKERKEVMDLGGLHIIGTERHEARRIDNQLRGRAGRQGDPGSSKFYISADDDLMRIFGGDRMKSLMAVLKVPEDMPIDNKIVSRSIESAQKKVEGNNFDIRKHLVEYDDVINKHRESIYKRRREILEIADGDSEQEKSEDSINDNNQSSIPKENKNKNEVLQDDTLEKKTLSSIILNMIEEEIERVVSFHTGGENIVDWNLEEIYQVISTIFAPKEKLKADLKDMVGPARNALLATAGGDNGKLDKVKARTTIIEHLIKSAEEEYDKIKKGFNEAGLEWINIEKGILIRSIDTLWIDHLDAMTQMRRGIGLRGYGQRDPLVEYKKEAYSLYNEFNSLFERQVVYSIFKVADVANFEAPNLSERAKNFSAPAKTMDSSTSSFSGFKKSNDDNEKSGDLVREVARNEEGKKVGRNDPCPCGSGKKFKKCCGK